MLPTMIVVPSVTTMRNAQAGVVGGEVLAVVLALKPCRLVSHSDGAASQMAASRAHAPTIPPFTDLTPLRHYCS
jgi:hypothetical protein